jgi:hypothetical protein
MFTSGKTSWPEIRVTFSMDGQIGAHSGKTQLSAQEGKEATTWCQKLAA